MGALENIEERIEFFGSIDVVVFSGSDGETEVDRKNFTDIHVAVDFIIYYEMLNDYVYVQSPCK